MWMVKGLIVVRTIEKRDEFLPQAQAERIPGCALRLPFIQGRPMRARSIEGKAVAVLYPAGWVPVIDVGQELRRMRAGLVAVIRFGNGSRIVGWLFCASLWVSSLLVVWMTLGWIGLFMSGHVLSAGTYWVKGLAKRTPAAMAPGAKRSGSGGIGSRRLGSGR